MKRYIDEKTGKIVNILEKDEAEKIVKILMDYFFSGASVPAGRLNLVGFLRDFIKLGNIEDLSKIVDYIGEYKNTLKLSKEDEADFEVLHKFFRMYKDLEESKLGIEDATNYISEMTNKKDELIKKEEKDMTKKDKILKVFFDNGFEFKRLAKVACEAWENHIKEQMNSGKKEIYISLEQEIAYQDLLEFVSSDNAGISKKEDNIFDSNKKQVETKSEANAKVVEQTEEKKVEKIKNEEIKEAEKVQIKEESKELKDNNIDKTAKVDINVQMPDRKDPVKIEIETKKDEKVNENAVSIDKKEEKIHTIQINSLVDEDDEIISSGNNNIQPFHKNENEVREPNKITQQEINSLLGLDDDLLNNSNSGSIQHKEDNVKKVDNVDKKEEKIHTIQINPLVDDEKKEPVNKVNQESNVVKPQMTNEEKNRREQGYTSNIHIYVPGVDDVKEQNNVNPSDVKKATENVNLKESVDFFNNVLDDRMSKNSLLSDDDSDGFRD